MCEMKKYAVAMLDENDILRDIGVGLLMLVQENAIVLERIRELVDEHGCEYLKARLADTGMCDVYVSDIGALNCIRSAGTDAGNEEDRQRVYPSNGMLVH